MPLLVACLAALLSTPSGVVATPEPPPDRAPQLAFEDIGTAAGIHMTLASGDSRNRYIVETMSGGVALIDYDNDGWLDVYLVDGSTLDLEQRGGKRNANRLYRNNRGTGFVDATATARAGGHHWGMGVCAGDVNNDGFIDLYITNLGPNILYVNNGDGTFRDASARSGAAHQNWSTSCAFGDYDRDGDLDLYVATYLEFDVHNPPVEIDGRPCATEEIPYCGPLGLKAAADRLFENIGNGRFVDVSARSGIHRVPPATSLGVVWFDSERDGDLDLYVANDLMPNVLFRNDGNGTFTDIAPASGTALSFDGRSQAGMGVDAADYDDDGDFDVVVTNFANDYNTLYRNDGSNRFSDGSTRGGLVAPSLPFVGWGVQFVDLDLDGRQDLSIANGHVYPSASAPGTTRRSAGYKQRNLLFWNGGNHRFVDAGKLLPGLVGFNDPNLARGLASGDLNNDGLVDLAVTRLHDRPQILLNRSSRRGSWLTLQLVGTASNRSAVGAVASVRTGGVRRSRLVKSGGSYQSHSDLRLHFGLGTATVAEELVVTWPSGRTSTLANVTLNRLLTIKEP